MSKWREILLVCGWAVFIVVIAIIADNIGA
jgi:hypothetical protein